MTTCIHKYAEVEGLFAITRSSILPNQKVSFMPSAGVPVVLSFCQKCGKGSFYAKQMIVVSKKGK